MSGWIRMMKDIFKARGNQLKMNILYLLLLISNIVLLVGLIVYLSTAGISVDMDTIEYFSTVIPSIIILGFITSRLAKLRERGSTLYDMGYLIIITVLGLMTSYFSDHANTTALFGQYLEMFRILSVILIFILMATMLKSFKEIMQGKFTRKNQLICFAIFLILALWASRFHVDIDGAPANVRCMVVMISGLFGGPVVGIPVGLISGAYRFTMGGVTALPCAISTVISGIVGSLFFIWNDRKFPRPLAAVVLMFLYIGFEMLLIVVITPPNISFPFVRNIYPVMLFSSVIGVILFSMVINDERQKIESGGDGENIIDELENEIGSNEDIQELKKEIVHLKSEIERLKKD